MREEWNKGYEKGYQDAEEMIKMNNKPVAWRKVVGNVTKHYQYNEMGEGTPLYTHPAKTLTDEEIKQIFQEQTGFFFDDSPADNLALMDFARAILRKAQEK